MPIMVLFRYKSHLARGHSLFIHKTGGGGGQSLWWKEHSDSVTRRGPAAAGRTSTCWPAAGAGLWGCAAAGRPCWSAGWRCCCTAAAVAAAGAAPSRPASASTRSAATGRSRGWRRWRRGRPKGRRCPSTACRPSPKRELQHDAENFEPVNKQWSTTINPCTPTTKTQNSKFASLPSSFFCQFHAHLREASYLQKAWSYKS